MAGVLLCKALLGVVGLLLSMALLGVARVLLLWLVVFAFVSHSVGRTPGMCVGISDATFDHTAGSFSSDTLNQLLVDESGSEFDSSSSSKFSLMSGDTSRLVGFEIFFSDLLSDLSSDGSQLGEGLALVVLDVSDDFVDCDNCVASSRVLDFPENVLGGMFSNLLHEALVNVRDHLFNGVLDLMSDLLQVLV